MQFSLHTNKSQIACTPLSQQEMHTPLQLSIIAFTIRTPEHNGTIFYTLNTNEGNNKFTPIRDANTYNLKETSSLAYH